MDFSRALIAMLFPEYQNAEEREALENLLRVSGLFVDPTKNVAVLESRERRRPLGYVHAWMRDALTKMPGPAIILHWSSTLEFLETMSFFDTMDRFVPAARDARKVSVVPNFYWPPIARAAGISAEREYFEQDYQSTNADSSRTSRTIFLIRLPPGDPLTVSSALGPFLGTRARRQSSVNFPAVRPDNQPKTTRKKDRDEITQQVVITNPLTGEHRIPKVVETGQPRAKRVDPRREEEDERPTEKPPAPDSLPPFLKPQH